MAMPLDLRIAMQQLLFWNDDSGLVGNYSGIAQSGTGLTALYLSLHTADPATTTDQSQAETTYPGYLRIAVNRDSGAWDVDAAAIASNIDIVDFDTASGATTDLITHVGLGTDSSGAGWLIESAGLTSPLQMANGVFAEFATGAIRFSLT